MSKLALMFQGKFHCIKTMNGRKKNIVAEFSSICCTSMAHAGNTKIWAKIISAYAKKCSITGFSSLRGGGGAKTASIYALSGHERIEKPSDQ